MRNYLLLPILGATLFISNLSAEKSAFEAGDVTSKAPYGLSNNEKVLLQNKKKMSTINTNVSSVNMKVGNIEEQIDGIRSVLDGTNIRVNEINKRVKAIEGFSDDKSSPNSLQSLKVYVEQTRKIENENNEKVKKVLNELSALIDSINSDYVPKSQFELLAKRVDVLDGKKTKKLKKDLKEKAKDKSKSAKKTKKSQKTKEAKKSNKSNWEMISDGREFFEKGKLDEAKENFELMVSKKYRPAESNYMLGEIAYKKKSWIDALKYYERSVKLYDKAKYIPRLLYHTGICYDKLGQPKDANKFYSVLKQNFPNSKEAKAAPSR